MIPILAIFAVAALLLVVVSLALDLRRLRLAINGSSFSTPVIPTRSLLSWTIPCYRKLLEEADSEILRLRQSEEDSRTRYQVLTNNVAAAVIIHEIDGTLMWCSPYTEVLTGFSVSEILAAKNSFFSVHVHEEDRDMLKRALGIISTGDPFQCRYRFYHKSGTMLWLETRTVPIFDDGLDGYVALSITLDVTASVNNQTHVEDRNKDLQDFTYMISHDLKAPIFTIRGMLGIINEDAKDAVPPSVTEALTYIERATNRLEQLVSGVLELAKVSAVDQSNQAIELSTVLAEVREDYLKPISDLGGSLNVTEGLPTILGNKTQVYQIFSNLVNNAVKYRSQDRALQIAITVHQARSPRRSIITVTDNGRGIPADKIPLLFKPFQRIGEEAIEGTGVGLACVHRLVEKMGGEITVSSEEGTGTTFTLELRRGKAVQLSSEHPQISEV